MGNERQVPRGRKCRLHAASVLKTKESHVVLLADHPGELPGRGQLVAGRVPPLQVQLDAGVRQPALLPDAGQRVRHRPGRREVLLVRPSARDSCQEPDLHDMR